VPAQLLRDADEAAAAARELGYPVALDLGDEPALRAAGDTMPALGALTAQRMASLADGVEVIIGRRQDPRVGPIVLVGLGGIYAEILKDTAVALAPVEADEAMRMFATLRGTALLSGARPAGARHWRSGACRRSSLAPRGRVLGGRSGAPSRAVDHGRQEPGERTECGSPLRSAGPGRRRSCGGRASLRTISRLLAVSPPTMLRLD
jgi:hypothetical protein